MSSKGVGVLTTVFSPPSECLLNAQTAGWDFNTAAGWARGWFADGVLAKCLPNNAPATDDNGRDYSPGVCPAGWTPSPQTVTNDQTTVHCCLTGTYPYYASDSAHAPEGWGDWCGATIGDAIAIHTGASGVAAAFGAGQQVMISSTYIAAPIIHITWAASDLNDFSPASAPLAMVAGSSFTAPTPTSTTTSTSSTTSTTTPSPTSTSDAAVIIATIIATTDRPLTITTTASTGVVVVITNTPYPLTLTSTSSAPQSTNGGGGGLSTGAQAGIGVGVGIVGLAAIALAIFMAFKIGARRGLKSGHKRETDVEVVHSVQPEMEWSR